MTMPDPYEIGPCKVYSLSSGLSTPHVNDLSLAQTVYGDGTPDLALSKWRRATDDDPSLRDDFLWRPSVPSRHKSFPIDRLTKIALEHSRRLPNR
jgi:hypothetical protein